MIVKMKCREEDVGNMLLWPTRRSTHVMAWPWLARGSWVNVYGGTHSCLLGKGMIRFYFFETWSKNKLVQFWKDPPALVVVLSKLQSFSTIKKHHHWESQAKYSLFNLFLGKETQSSRNSGYGYLPGLLSLVTPLKKVLKPWIIRMKNTVLARASGGGGN
jgi:hypothetical protein